MTTQTKPPQLPRKYTPEYMREGYIPESTRRAMSRMAPHLKPIDAMLTVWALECNYDGAPRLPAETMLKRIIEQTALGAAQSGGRVVLNAASYVDFADWAVALMREQHRRVVYAEYVHFPDWPAERKCRQIGITLTAWKSALHESRETIYYLLRGFGFQL